MGGIAGIVGGPAGSAVGASLGAYVGLLADWAHAGIDLKFLDDTGKTLGVGKAAVLAEIEESWTSLLEPRLRQQGGLVFRRFRTDVADDQLLQESIALERALEALEDKLDEVTTVNRDELEKSSTDVKQRLKAIQDRARVAIDLKKAETDLKVKALLQQAETAAEEAKSEVRKRISDAQTDFEMRSKKLSQAWGLAKEALAPRDRPGQAG